MLFGARIAVVVPAYDEAAHIRQTLASIPGYVDDVVVVDDASSDDTAGAARAAADPRVRVLRHDRNRGVGAAIATGYRAAFAGGADVAAVMAGDGQMHPDDLRELLRPVARGEADYAKGDRLGHPAAWRAMPLERWLGNHVLSRLTAWATGVPVRDSQCGYTALGRRAAEAVSLEDLWPRYGYPNDLLGEVVAAGLRVREVVVRPVYRGEASGMRWWHGAVVIPYVIARGATRRAQRASARRAPSSGLDHARAGRETVLEA